MRMQTVKSLTRRVKKTNRWQWEQTGAKRELSYRQKHIIQAKTMAVICVTVKVYPCCSSFYSVYYLHTVRMESISKGQIGSYEVELYYITIVQLFIISYYRNRAQQELQLALTRACYYVRLHITKHRGDKVKTELDREIKSFFYMQCVKQLKASIANKKGQHEPNGCHRVCNVKKVE